MIDYAPQKITKKNPKNRNNKENENENEISYSERNKMQLNFCLNIINRNNSRQQMPPKIMKPEIKDDFF